MFYRENYESAFADEGSRAEISQLLWELGWREIVGGVNGVPTVQQFNEVCGRIDRKANELKNNKLDLDGDASRLKVGEELLINYIADVGAKIVIFEMADVRENIESGETMAVILGKIQKFFEDLRPNAFKEADDPFVFMTSHTFVPVGERTKGSLYALETNLQGVVIDIYNRFVNGTEAKPVARTIYAKEQSGQSGGTPDPLMHIGRCANLILVPSGSAPGKEQYKLYAVEKAERGR